MSVVPPPANLTSYAILQHLRSSLADNFGTVSSGAHGSSLAIRYYSPATRTAIVRCGRAGVVDVVSACTLLASIEGRRVRIVVRHVGGTIRKVQEAAVRLDRRRIERAKMARRSRARQLDSLSGLEREDEGQSITEGLGKGGREAEMDEEETEEAGRKAMEELMQLKGDGEESSDGDE